jgi:hypothetical protein
MRSIIPVAIGVTTFTLLQGAWSLTHPHAIGDEARVFSGAFGMLTCSAIFGVATALTVAHRHEPKDLLRRSGMLWLGMLAAMVIAEFIIGPQNLWVFRIAAQSVFVFGAVVLGGIVGAIIASRGSGARNDAA